MSFISDKRLFEILIPERYKRGFDLKLITVRLLNGPANHNIPLRPND